MSLYKPKAVYATSEQQYTATGEVQVLRGGIYVWRKAECQEINTQIGKANISTWALSLCGYKMGAFKHCKAVSFQIGFVPILTYGHESGVMTNRIVTQVQAPKTGFLWRVHGVTKGAYWD